LFQAPVVSGLPTQLYIGERETGQRLLYIYEIIDPNSNPFTCSNMVNSTLGGANAFASGDEFDLKKNTDTGSKYIKCRVIAL